MLFFRGRIELFNSLPVTLLSIGTPGFVRNRVNVSYRPSMYWMASPSPELGCSLFPLHGFGELLPERFHHRLAPGLIPAQIRWSGPLNSSTQPLDPA